ncbi:serine hydrolase domain-containing protein [Colwellia piezophila]|uniref:serine hydrolase domain-containing protein n=1 Tax=Colwellia piezophila TaxID=211668 RepID=UPI0003808C08|nr:serine hydrolase domain-containing protein [Colwellia piezophila]
MPILTKVYFVPLMLLTAYSLTSQANENKKQEIWQKQLSAAAIVELKQSGTASLQIAVGYKNKIIFSDAYGLADIENNILATPQTKYRIASISKWFTSSATMSLIETGALDLNAPIQKYCPKYPLKLNVITTKQLLTHTSGIRHYADYNALLSRASSDDERTKIERKRFIDQLGRYTRYTEVITPLNNFKEDPLLFKPGTNWKYTSYGFRTLACVLQGAAKKPYREIMEDLIFTPLAMNNTVDDDAWAIIPHRASGYRLNKNKKLRRANMRDVSENLPAGGHLSTATDLILFAQAFNNNQLISEKTKSLMISPYSKNEMNSAHIPSWRDAIPSKYNYGMGVMLFPNDEQSWFGHTGQQAGSSSIVFVIPEHDISIAVLTNIKGWRGYMSFTREIASILVNASAEGDL